MTADQHMSQVLDCTEGQKLQNNQQMHAERTLCQLLILLSRSGQRLQNMTSGTMDDRWCTLFDQILSLGK